VKTSDSATQSILMQTVANMPIAGSRYANRMAPYFVLVLPTSMLLIMRLVGKEESMEDTETFSSGYAN
jgi:hypothetical protein